MDPQNLRSSSLHLHVAALSIISTLCKHILRSQACWMALLLFWLPHIARANSRSQNLERCRQSVLIPILLQQTVQLTKQCQTFPIQLAVSPHISDRSATSLTNDRESSVTYLSVTSKVESKFPVLDRFAMMPECQKGGLWYCQEMNQRHSLPGR